MRHTTWGMTPGQLLVGKYGGTPAMIVGATLTDGEGCRPYWEIHVLYAVSGELRVEDEYVIKKLIADGTWQVIA